MTPSVLKQVVGIDVSQKELVVSLGRMQADLCSQVYSHAVFANTAGGMQALIKWTTKQTQADIPLRFVMEATGVYHESLAYYLVEQGYAVSIVLPNKISNYMRTLDIKTITDKTASQAIALFGLERQLTDWQRPDPLYKAMRQLTRERDQLMQNHTMVKNQLHAEKAEASPHQDSIRRMTKHLAFLKSQLTEIEVSLQALIQRNPGLKEIMELCTSICGIGNLTAAIILAETNGFELIRNKRQLVSFAGLDVKEKQSGSSVKGKPHISKKGNRFIRKAMHMPALTAKGRDEHFKAIFARLVAKHGVKMKAVVAIQRKLLEMMYTVYKTRKPYDPNYYKKLESSHDSYSLNRLA